MTTFRVKYLPKTKQNYMKQASLNAIKMPSDQIMRKKPETRDLFKQKVQWKNIKQMGRIGEIENMRSKKPGIFFCTADQEICEKKKWSACVT